MNHALLPETPLGTPKPLPELLSQRMLCLRHIQLTLSTSNFFKKDTLSQKQISALTPIKLLLRMRHALLKETLLGTPSPLPEPLSQPMPRLPHIQLTPSTSNLDLRVTLTQRPTFALTQTRPLPRMRLAPLPETPPGIPSPLPEPLSQLTPRPPHIQPTLSTFNSNPMLLMLQRLTPALTPTRPPLKMSHAPPLETPLGTPSPHPEP
jgi:hypothetical protein